ncbi:MAG: SdrD B-like domain-containing protein [Candidatus Bathyarchaeia archaeon]
MDTKNNLLRVALVLLIISMLAISAGQTGGADWDSIAWVLIDEDFNEPSPEDWRDILAAYIAYDESYLYLKLTTVSPPMFPTSPNDRDDDKYRWFIDLDGNMYWQGNVLHEAEYLLSVQDKDDNGVGEMYLLFDSDNDGEFNDEQWGTIQVNSTDGGFRIFGNHLEVYISWSKIGGMPSVLWLSWCTDKSDQHLNQCPNMDRAETAYGTVIPLGSISGYKWEDLNGDGARDYNEPLLPEWEIRLQSGSISLIAYTNSSGYYQFLGLPNGTYTVSEAVQDGWIQTYPGNNSYIVQIGSGQQSADKNFGNMKTLASISVRKTANTTITHVGDKIKYSYNVTNTGNVPLTIQYIDDDAVGKIMVGKLLNPGEWIEETAEYTVIQDSSDPLVNKATVYANYTDQLVSAWDAWTVDILHPAVEVEKNGPAYAYEGDTIAYTITVKNTGDCPLYNMIVEDDLLGTIYSGDLGFGETKTCTKTYTVKAGDPDPLKNTVTAAGEDTLGLEVSDSDSWTVDILHPAIAIDKYADETMAHEGDAIHYTYEVTNVGDCPLYSVSVTDSLGIAVNYYDEIGDGDWILEDGEVWRFNATYLVPTPQIADVENTGTAHGFDILNREVTATDSWTVDVLHPAFKVIKSANATMIHEGDWVKYNVTVVNTGDCDLDVTFSDEALGISWTGTLKPNEKHEEILSIQPTDDPTVNEANATGVDPLGMEVYDEASWTVDILQPSIDVSKFGPLYAHEGDIITYTITVVNTGDSPLSDVSVVDSLLGTIYSDGFAYGETKTFTVTYTVPTPSGDISNTVTASGKDALGKVVSDSDSWTVDVLHPSIMVTKIVNVTWAHVGDVIEYVISVTNAGDCTIYDLNVTDSLFGNLTTNGVLNVGDNVTFERTYIVETGDPDPLVNTVIASGKDALGLVVSANASASVDLIAKYNITFGQLGLDNTADSNAVCLVINGTSIKVSDLPLSMLVDEGAKLEFSYFNVSSTVEGKRFTLSSVNASSPLTVDGSKLIIGEYKTQYKLTINVSPPGAGSISANPPSPDGYYDAGTNVSVTATSSNGYAFSYWNLDGINAGSNIPITVTMDAPHNLTAVFTSATYTFTVHVYRSGTSTGIQGVTVKVDGNNHMTDSSGKVSLPMSYGNHTVEVVSPFSPSSGTRYLFTQWGDNSTANPRTISVTSNTTLTAYMNLEYYLTVQVGSGSGTVSPYSGWYQAGSSVLISATPSEGYAFDCWAGSGLGSYNGSSSSASVMMNAPITQTAYFFTFSISVSPSSGSVTQGGSISATVTATYLSGYNSKTISLSASGLPSGASVSFSPSSVTISPSSTSASSIMTISTSTSTPTGTYEITITGSGGGVSKSAAYTLTITVVTYTTHIINFYVLDDAGSAVSGATLVFAGSSYSHGESTSVAAGSYSLSVGTIPSGYRFLGWEASDGVSVASQTSSSTTATVSGSGSITMRLQRTTTVTFSVSGMDSDVSGIVLSVDGAGYGYSSLPVSFTWDVGSSHSFAWTDYVGAGSGKRYIWVSTSGLSTARSGSIIVPSEGGLVNATYKTQYYLMVISPYDTPSGEGWYDSGDKAYASLATGIVNLTTGMHAVFTGWSGDASGTDLVSNPIIMDAPKTAVANWIIQYRVIFNQMGLDQSANEAVVTVNGSEKKLEDLPFTLWVDYGSSVSYTYRDVVSSIISGKQFKLEDVIGPNSPITVTEPVNITGNYQTLYYLLVVSDYGSPRGSGWYPFNSEARFGVTTPVDHGNRTLRVFLKWYGDVSIFEPEGAILITKPSVVIASWETQYLVTFNTTLPNKYILRVPGVPETLPPGMDVFGMYYPEGEHITVGPAPIIVPGVEGIRYVLAGWALDGEIFTYDVNMSFIVEKPHDVAVLYDTEYLLNVNAAGVSDPFTATVAISSRALITRELTPTSSIQEWFRQGTDLALTVSTPNKIGHGDWAIFKEWVGHLQAVNRTISFTMLSPRDLNAVFFKVNPVAESIPYSVVAGLISMLLCVISARRRASNGKKRRSAASGIIVSAVALIVAAIVSIIIATGYGININELLDFTNWAVIFLIFEAIMFALVTAAVVRKVQRRKEAPLGES